MRRIHPLRTAINRALPGPCLDVPSIAAPMVVSGAMAIAMFGSTTAAAQEAEAETTLSTIKVRDEATAPTTQIGKIPQTLRDIPQTLTVISRETLDAQSAS